MTPDGRVPVTVVTGFLGAGKTSLINHVLHHSAGRRLAVIVNEFGEIGLDGELIDSGAEDVIELSNGCVCCAVRGDLIRTLRALLKSDDRFGGIVIETTGVANPSPIIQTFYADQSLAARCRLDTVATVVDAIHFGGKPEFEPDQADQVALASVVFLNKASDASAIEAVEARVRGLNPIAPVHRIDRGRADPASMIDTGGFDLARVDETFKAESHDHADHLAEAGIASVALFTDAPLDAERLETWLRDLLRVRGNDILRTKGIIWAEGSDRKLVLQAVQMLIEGDFTAPWGEAGPHRSHLVFIGRNLDATALRQGFLACRATVKA
jgi:G3E family GTPase